MAQLNSENDSSSNSKNVKLFKYWSLGIFITFIFSSFFQAEFFPNIWICLVAFNATFLFQNLNSLRLLPNFLGTTNGLFSSYEYQILAILLLIPFSNSFVINENISLRFVLVTLLYFQSFYTKSSTPILLALLVRISSVFFVCREEIASYCSPTIFSTPLGKLTAYNYSNYLAFILFNFFLLFSLFFYFIKLNSTKLFSPINLLNFFSLSLLLIYNLNELQIHEYSIVGQQRLDLKRVNLYIARLIYFVVAFVICLSYSNKLRLFNSIVAIGVFLSLLSSQSLFSIWILISILFILFLPKYHPSILKGNFFFKLNNL